MATLSRQAVEQIDELRRHFAAKARPEAIERLADAVQGALIAVDSPRVFSRPYPATYRSLATDGTRWIKVHRYWFSYIINSSGSIVTDVMYDSADIPGRSRGQP